MRRGYTIIELITSIGVLSVLLSVMLSFLFASDRASERLAVRSVRQGNTAALLSDLSQDLREGALNRGATWTQSASGAARTASGDTRTYPGCRYSLTRRGRLAALTVTCGKERLQTTIFVRN